MVLVWLTVVEAATRAGLEANHLPRSASGPVAGREGRRSAPAPIRAAMGREWLIASATPVLVVPGKGKGATDGE